MPERAGTGRLLKGTPGHFWVAAALTAAADLISKTLIFGIPPGRFVTTAEFPQPHIPLIPGFLSIVHSENRGGVFGLAQGSGLWLVFGLIAVGMVVWFAHRKDTRAALVQVALGLVLGGAIGNLFDRVAFGCVRDFIDVCYWPGKHWPAFNVADSGISVGAAYLAIYAFFFMPRSQEPAKKG